MKGPLAKLLLRGGWNVVDQALSSLSNAALSILVARLVDPRGYGNFAIAFTLYAFLIGISQAVANKPYLIRAAAQTEKEALTSARGSTGAALVFGLLCSLIMVPVALLLPAGTRPAILVMALLLPGLFVQEAFRTVFLARERARTAALVDGCWAALQLGGLGVALLVGVHDPAVLIGAWGVSGWCAALFAARLGRTSPQLRAGIDYMRRHADLSRFMVAEWITVVGSGQLALLLVAYVGSVTDVGALRGAQTLLGPLNILSIAAMTFVVPELVRRPWLSRMGIRLSALSLSLGTSLVTLAWGLGLLLLPTAQGEQLLGATWAATRLTLLPMTLWICALSLSAGPIAVLQMRADSRSTFLINAVLGPAVLAGAVGGFFFGGAAGTAWGMVGAAVVTLPLWWIRMETGAREPLTARS